VLVAPRNEDGTFSLFSAQVLVTNADGTFRAATSQERDDAVMEYGRLQRLQG